MEALLQLPPTMKALLFFATSYALGYATAHLRHWLNVHYPIIRERHRLQRMPRPRATHPGRRR
jgi:hypothetical protein